MGDSGLSLPVAQDTRCEFDRLFWFGFRVLHKLFRAPSLLSLEQKLVQSLSATVPLGFFREFTTK